MKVFNVIFILLLINVLYSCSKEKIQIDPYQAPELLPDNLVPGDQMNDAILTLYDDLGIVVYTDTEDPRFRKDLVSDETLQLPERLPADTSAVLFYIKMIRDELYSVLPDDKKYLAPRNFYVLKSPLVSGTGYYKYKYKSYLWSNSFADVTVGSLDETQLDTTLLKESLIYALSSVLRGQKYNSGIFGQFQTAADDAGYYWSVTSDEAAYSNGFITSDQGAILSDQQDFDSYAAWAATVNPNTRDSILTLYPGIATKYSLVSAVFRSEGIPLEQINEKWQDSPLNPNH